MASSPVHVVPIYLPGQPPVLAHLMAQIARAFATDVVVLPLRFDPEVAFDNSRGQYNSTLLLSYLLTASTGKETCILGVASVDLFIPILTYVFGEAQLDGRAAIVSTFRLDNARYGLPDNPGLLLDRAAKEAIHELGHTRGLIHCYNAACVMRSSTYAEDIDLKSARFCSACARRMRSRPPRSPGWEFRRR